MFTYQANWLFFRWSFMIQEGASACPRWLIILDSPWLQWMKLEVFLHLPEKEKRVQAQFFIGHSVAGQAIVRLYLFIFISEQLTCKLIMNAHVLQSWQIPTLCMHGAVVNAPSCWGGGPSCCCWLKLGGCIDEPESPSCVFWGGLAGID